MTSTTSQPRLAAPARWPGPMLVAGFGAAVAVWCAWFITHLPWIGLDERLSLPIVLGVWLTAAVAAGALISGRSNWLVGAASGVVTSLLGLSIFFSRTVPGATPQGPAPDPDVPSLVLIAVGFVLLGGVIGAIGGAAGRLIRPSADRAVVGHGVWLGRFAIVTAAAVLPLIFVGGLVTSTNSGMAVPDWPGSFGSNMFLYPLGPRSPSDRFLEHSHRLFGTLVGMAALTLMAYTLVVERRGWVRRLAIGVFLFVLVQGILGGLRVRLGDRNPDLDLRWLAIVHGILAHLVFAMIVGLAAVLSPTFKIDRPIMPRPEYRRLKFLATAMVHATLLQLIFGALYRHTRSPHSLWTHAGFSVLVVGSALAVAFLAATLGSIPQGPPEPLARTIRRTARAILVVVGLQFVLGWVTFGFGGSTLQAETSLQALIRTGHQANGAFFIALAALMYTWVLRLRRLAANRPETPPVVGV